MLAKCTMPEYPVATWLLESNAITVKLNAVPAVVFAGKATVMAEGVPLFRGAFGVSRGQQCVRYEQRVRRPGNGNADLAMLRR